MHCIKSSAASFLRFRKEMIRIIFFSQISMPAFAHVQVFDPNDLCSMIDCSEREGL